MVMGFAVDLLNAMLSTRNARVAFQDARIIMRSTCRINGQSVFILGRSSGRFRTVEGYSTQAHRRWCLPLHQLLARFRVGSDAFTLHIEDMRRVVPSLQLINLCQMSRAFQESLIILLFRSTPLCFTSAAIRGNTMYCAIWSGYIPSRGFQTHTGNELLFFPEKGQTASAP